MNLDKGNAVSIFASLKDIDYMDTTFLISHTIWSSPLCTITLEKVLMSFWPNFVVGTTGKFWLITCQMISHEFCVGIT